MKERTQTTLPAIQANAVRPGKFKTALARTGAFFRDCLPGAGVYWQARNRQLEKEKRRIEGDVGALVRGLDDYASAVEKMRKCKGVEELYLTLCEGIASGIGLDNVRIFRIEGGNGEKFLSGKVGVDARGEETTIAHLSHTLVSGDGHVSTMCVSEKKIIHLEVDPVGKDVKMGTCDIKGITVNCKEMQLGEKEKNAVLERASWNKVFEKIAVPLFDGDEPIGVIVADNRRTQKHIDDNSIITLYHRAMFASAYISEKENSLYDTLTALPNRRYYNVRSLEALEKAKRDEKPLSCIVLDINYFKRINDAHGLPAGDAVLVGAANLLLGKLHSGEILCRWGGDEFVILLPGVSAEDAADVIGERLRAAFEAATIARYGDVEFKVTVSCGVAQYDPERDSTPNDLFKRAGDTLLMAKAKKNTVVVDVGQGVLEVREARPPEPDPASEEKVAEPPDTSSK